MDRFKTPEEFALWYVSRRRELEEGEEPIFFPAIQVGRDNFGRPSEEPEVDVDAEPIVDIGGGPDRRVDAPDLTELGGERRGIGGLFDPFQALQDPVFAVLAGALDSERSIASYLNDIDPSDYGFGGAAPERPVVFRDILSLMGVTNENALQIGGFLGDVVVSADMFLPIAGGLGAATKSVGVAAKGASGVASGGAAASRSARAADTALDGLIAGGDQLATWARNTEDALSLIPITRGGTTRSVYNTTASVLPASVRNNIQQASQRMFEQLFGVPSIRTAVTELGEQGRTVVELGDSPIRAAIMGNRGIQNLVSMVSRVLPGSQAARLQFGAEAGADIFRAQGRGEELGEQIRTYVLDGLGEINRLLGIESPNVWSNVFRAIGLRRDMVPATNRISSGTRDAIIARIGSLGQQYGAGLLNTFDAVEFPQGMTQRFEASMQQIQDVLPEAARLDAERAVDLALKDILEFAARNGDDAERVETAFRRSLEISVASDALVGYHLSMFEPVQNHFLRTVATIQTPDLMQALSIQRNSRLGGLIRENRVTAQDSLWRSALAAGLRGDDVNGMTTFTLFADDGAVVMRDIPIQNIFGVETLGDILQQNKFFQQSNLDLGKYLNAVANGHFRRSFAAFQSDRKFTNYLDSLRNGRLIPNNIISSQGILEDLSRAGFGDEAALIADYVDNVGSALISRESLIDYLLDRGVPAARANNAVARLNAVGNPKMMAFIKKVEEAVARFNVPDANLGADFGVRSAFTAERSDLTDEMLELLGELSGPLLALEESSRYARNVVPRQVYLQTLYDVGVERGLVRSAEEGPGRGFSGVRLADTPVYGPFAGMYVHPYLRNMVDLGLKRPEYRNDAFLNRSMNLVRGGMLAAPRVLGINIVGGLATTSGLGLSPFRMAGELVGVANDFRRVADGELDRIDDLELLREMIPLNISRLGDIAITEQSMARLRRAAVGMPQQGVRPFLDAMYEVLRTGIENPAELIVGSARGGMRGPGARTIRRAGAVAGLEGFATSETMMKLAAFRAAQKSGFDVAEAAELARISVFDYSEIPEFIRRGQRNGLLLFPGFPYFIGARNLTGALRRPGQAAAIGRIPDAIYDSQMTDEEKGVIISSMPPWLRESFGVPFRQRTLPDGSVVASVYPFSQVVPNLKWYDGGGGLLDLLTSLGFVGALADVAFAYGSGTGVGPISGQRGGVVFEQGRTPIEKLGQTMGFIANSFAPTNIRSGVSYRPGDGVSGIIPEIANSMIEIPEPLASSGYSARELASGRVRRDFMDNVIAAAFRTPTPVVLSGPFASLNRNFAAAQARLNEELQTYQQDYELAMLNQNQEGMQRAAEKRIAAQRRFAATWGPVLENYQSWSEQQGTRQQVIP